MPEAGVEVFSPAAVDDSATDVPLAWAAEEVRRIGEVDSGAFAFGPLRPSDVQVFGGDRILVLDRMNHRIQLFDSAGSHIETLGRRGGGPGELQAPASLVVDSEGGVLVLDYARRGFLRFDPSGAPGATWGLDIPYWGHAMDWFGDGVLLTIAEGYRTGELLVTERLVHLRYEERGYEEVAAIERPNPDLVQYPGCVGIQLDPVFAVQLRWASSPVGIVVSGRPDYEIHWYGRDRELRAVSSRPIQPRQATPEMALAQIGERVTIQTPYGQCSIRPEDLLEGRGFAEQVPTVGRLALSPEGRLWVSRYAIRGETQRIDIFEPDGSYAGTLPDGFPFPAGFLTEDRIVALERDDFDVDYVVLYRIVREPS